MVKLLIAFFTVLAVSGCSGIEADSSYPEQIGKNKYGKAEDKPEGLFGPDGIVFGNIGKSSDTGLNINSYLWRASLDTVSFIPLLSVDPFGGVIITDWYSPENVTNERFKLNILIMSSALRADGVKVSAFRQTMDGQGRWKDQKADTEIAVKIENAILTRARELKISR